MPAPPHSTAGGEPVGAPGLMWGYGDAGGAPSGAEGYREERRGAQEEGAEDSGGRNRGSGGGSARRSPLRYRSAAR